MTVLLWALVAAALTMSVVSTLLVIALARRLNVYRQDLGVSDTLPTPGRRITSMDVQTIDDRSISSAAFDSDSMVLAYVSHGCEPCRSQVTQLLVGDVQPPAPVVVLASGDWPEAELVKIAEGLGDGGHVAQVAMEGAEERIVGGDLNGYPTIVHIDGGRIVSAGRRFSDLAAATRT